MALMKMGKVVRIAEGNHRPYVSWPEGTSENAAMFLVSRLFTDAVFNQDIRSIKMIVQRIDGGLPKDTDVEDVQTMFGDCLLEILKMRNPERLKVSPKDTVLMALAKSLFDIAVEDIYYDYKKNRPILKPSTDRKNERDMALQMVIERTGGRRTMTAKAMQQEEIEEADWIAELESHTEKAKEV